MLLAKVVGTLVATRKDPKISGLKFLVLRQVSRPAYYYYGLGDEVLLSVEIIPVRVR